MTSPDPTRLIERAFPLKQASLDSLHEKNVRHGHISTLHIWPARRPLAACRAALIATLLPDPGTPEARRALVERIGGKIVTKEIKKKLPSGKVKVEYKDQTAGGVLHWGQETSLDMDWFRAEIRKAYGGRAPRVLDPFAGGGAIPLEAMRLGCEVTAIDINPVAWFILKCTLEYPQKLAGQKRPLPDFVLDSPDFMEEYWKKGAKLSRKELQAKLKTLALDRGKAKQTGIDDHTKIKTPEADLAWHVSAWGHWVLERARKNLEKYYPTVDDKPTVAYLWARTLTCKNCRATMPLLRTRWLCKKDKKRVLLTIEPNKERTGVIFSIENDAPVGGGNAAQRREHDKSIGKGTVSRSGAVCPCCFMITPLEDYQYQGRAGALGQELVAVVFEGEERKGYRLPNKADLQAVAEVPKALQEIAQVLPHGLLQEPISGDRPSPNARGMSGLTRFGIDNHSKIYGERQLLALASFTVATRAVLRETNTSTYPREETEAILGYLYCVISRLADRNSSLCTWQTNAEKIGHTFSRYALTMTTDFVESSPFADSSGSYGQAVEWVARVVDHLCSGGADSPPPTAVHGSADGDLVGPWDIVITDPPYYDSVPYADVMDFFYVWARRTVGDLFPTSFATLLAPREKEFIQHAGRLGGDNNRAKVVYQENMAASFRRIHHGLRPDGRLVVVFAHKDPRAWETLAAAMIAAGFTVDASWPIQTERTARIVALSSAALSSSVWLVCRKRPDSARPGWDNQVLEEMRVNIDKRLREFWDAGIRGPDFVWAATGPALEAYSKHPIVKKANEPGQIMTVTDFLTHVRRIVVNFVVGRVLSHNGDGASAAGLDEVTTYYLLHRHDFGFDDAPAGACILYAVSCGLSDSALADEHDLLVRTGGTERDEEEDEEAPGDDDGDAEVEEGTGSTVRLKAWSQRTRKAMGYDANGKPAPLIDRVHRLMHLWRAGDVAKVDEYLEDHALTRNATFHQVLQALIELAKEGGEERRLLENLSNHVAAKGGTVKRPKAVEEYGTNTGAGAGGKPG